VRFDVGDAEKLPFDTEQFDVVTNVESSSHYPNLLEFYAEVFRVLVPGGFFLYADGFLQESNAESLALMEKSGFTMELERDITANVLLSCDEVAHNRTGAYNAGNDPELLNNFLAVPGSRPYEEMQSGHSRYQIYRLRKPLL
jgi:phthiocerol/phenolphthiocerol synthesis type-I polyketide synthase E